MDVLHGLLEGGALPRVVDGLALDGLLLLERQLLWSALLRALRSLGSPEQLGQRPLTHARALPRHRAPPSPGRDTPGRQGLQARI